MLNDHIVGILADCYNTFIDGDEIPDGFKEGVIITTIRVKETQT